MPANKPNSTDKPDKPRRPPSPPRRTNRFNQREFARAGRVAKALGGRVSCDPKTGIYTITFSDGTLTPPANEWDAATEKLKTNGQ